MATLPYISPSRLLAYSQCPAEYASRYIARRPFVTSPAVEFGKAVHSGIQTLALGGDGIWDFARNWLAMSRLLAQAQCPDPRYRTEDGLWKIEPSWFQRGSDLVEVAVQHGVSGEAEAPVKRWVEPWRTKLIGYMDFKDRLHSTIWELKTTGQLAWWTPQKILREPWQSRLYSWDYHQEFRELPHLKYLIMPRDGELAVKELDGTPTEDQMRETIEAGAEIISRIRADDFACTCGKHIDGSPPTDEVPEQISP